MGTNRTLYEYIASCGHQHFEAAEGSRHLMFGPVVPEGERWTLLLLAAKNNMNPNEYPAERATAELSVCVWFPPRPSEHDEPPPGTWVLLNGDVDVPQFRPVRWEGTLELRPRSRLGAWFRGAVEGDMLELDAVYDVEVVEANQGQGQEISDLEAVKWFVETHGLKLWPYEGASDEEGGPQICVETPNGTVCHSPQGWLAEMLDGTELGKEHLGVLKQFLAKEGTQ